MRRETVCRTDVLSLSLTWHHPQFQLLSSPSRTQIPIQNQRSTYSIYGVQNNNEAQGKENPSPSFLLWGDWECFCFCDIHVLLNDVGLSTRLLVLWWVIQRKKCVCVCVCVMLRSRDWYRDPVSSVIYTLFRFFFSNSMRSNTQRMVQLHTK